MLFTICPYIYIYMLMKLKLLKYGTYALGLGRCIFRRSLRPRHSRAFLKPRAGGRATPLQAQTPDCRGPWQLGLPRFPLQGSFKGDRYIDIDNYLDPKSMQNEGALEHFERLWAILLHTFVVQVGCWAGGCRRVGLGVSSV